ncbi:MAG TPA: D-aminoacyl-tRNA deacylase [Marinobacterium sp.]|nr:D-aminoacyl-tRNA deacylase [Marinobacterium sp.]
MKGLIQRVSQGQVDIDGIAVGKIGTGIVLLLGIEREDNEVRADKLLHKVQNYRIFPDDQGRMNLSLKDIDGELLIVSQFTLVADTAKGMRPGFSRGATPTDGERLYEYFISEARAAGLRVQTGQFGANMQVSLSNDGPVTFWLES